MMVCLWVFTLFFNAKNIELVDWYSDCEGPFLRRFYLSEKVVQGRLLIELRSKVETFGCLLLLQPNFNPS